MKSLTASVNDFNSPRLNLSLFMYGLIILISDFISVTKRLPSTNNIVLSSAKFMDLRATETSVYVLNKSKYPGDLYLVNSTFSSLTGLIPLLNTAIALVTYSAPPPLSSSLPEPPSMAITVLSSTSCCGISLIQKPIEAKSSITCLPGFISMYLFDSISCESSSNSRSVNMSVSEYTILPSQRKSYIV